MQCSWQSRRAAFNHDWLKNRYLPSLAKCLNVLDDRVEDSDFEQSFIARGFTEWESGYRTIQQLIDDFEDEMTPTRYLDDFCMDHETKKWLTELGHLLWVNRHSIRILKREALVAARLADERYVELRKMADSYRRQDVSSCFRERKSEVKAFYDACQELSSVVSRFPMEVSVL